MRRRCFTPSNRRHLELAELRQPRGRHRENGKTDAREYSVWVWDIEDRQRPGRGRPRWSTEQLPELPLEMRRWSPSAVPGTYPIEPALVDEIRRRYL